MSRDEILQFFELFSHGGEGIGTWLSSQTNSEIFNRLDQIDDNPLSQVQLNQLLVLGHEATMTDSFFRYYWLENPACHPYPVANLLDFRDDWIGSTAIQSLEQLRWGFRRLFTDGLLYFGNVRSAYRALRTMNTDQLTAFFAKYRFDTTAIRARGPALPLQKIARDNRYLISEMACKSFGDDQASPGGMRAALQEAFNQHLADGGGAITWRGLISGNLPTNYSDRQQEFLFSADDVLDEAIQDQDQFDANFETIAGRFFAARQSALANTHYYLSMVNDLDVYVATSMRTRQDFRNMAAFCDNVFNDDRLDELQLRYFDPTLSAAAGHEDKGLIECLMVKCAKVLVYCAGEKESYGKDAEAAMALSLGKPVVFFCDEERRGRFYRDIHPLSRLIEFKTGVAVGAIVTDSPEEVANILQRLFENTMQYELEQPKPNYLRLKEELTGSVVRLQTGDPLLTETFWNHYHNR